ncbi:MAG: hypothetical protein WCO03_02230 [bacterium]
MAKEIGDSMRLFFVVIERPGDSFPTRLWFGPSSQHKIVVADDESNLGEKVEKFVRDHGVELGYRPIDIVDVTYFFAGRSEPQHKRQLLLARM